MHNVHENKCPRLLLTQEFCEFESLARLLGWQQSFRQLSAGKLTVNVQVVGHERCLAIRLCFDGSFHQVGTPPDGFLTFGLPDPGQSYLHWAGADVEAGALINFNGPDGLDMTSRGHFCGTVVSIAVSCFRNALQRLEPGSTVMDETRQAPYWIPRDESLAQMRETLDRVFEAAAEQGDDALREYREAFDFGFVMDVLAVIHNARLPALPSPRYRLSVLKRALELLEADYEEEITVESLCRTIGTNYSTLSRAFQEEFGVTPNRYLRARRLTAARSALVLPGLNRSICQVAYDCGFSHMGAFAADYRKQFGELPSDTRSRVSHQ
jgi:AraC family ethanolamine operon transcriptional activator